MRINNNINALDAQRNLSMNGVSLSKSIERLSSGLRINRAADDAAGLSISEKLRANVRGLAQAISNAQDGISMIQTAEGALTEVHGMLQRMRELGVQAANDTLSDDDKGNIVTELVQLKAEMNNISATTKFNGKNLLTGSLATSVDSAITASTGLVSGEVLGVTGGRATVSAVDVTQAKTGKSFNLSSSAAGQLTLTDASDASATQTISVQDMAANGKQSLNFSDLGVQIDLTTGAGETKTAQGIITDLVSGDASVVATAANLTATATSLGSNAASTITIGGINTTVTLGSSTAATRTLTATSAGSGAASTITIGGVSTSVTLLSNVAASAANLAATAVTSATSSTANLTIGGVTTSVTLAAASSGTAATVAETATTNGTGAATTITIGGVNTTVTLATFAAAASGTVTGAAITATGTTTATISINSTVVTYSLGSSAAETASNVAAAIQAQSTTTGVTAATTGGGGNQVVLTTTGTGTAASILVAGGSGEGFTDGTTTGTDATGTAALNAAAIVSAINANTNNLVTAATTGGGGYTLTQSSVGVANVIDITSTGGAGTGMTAGTTSNGTDIAGTAALNAAAVVAAINANTLNLVTAATTGGGGYTLTQKTAGAANVIDITAAGPTAAGLSTGTTSNGVDAVTATAASNAALVVSAINANTANLVTATDLGGGQYRLTQKTVGSGNVIAVTSSGDAATGLTNITTANGTTVTAADNALTLVNAINANTNNVVTAATTGGGGYTLTQKTASSVDKIAITSTGGSASGLSLGTTANGTDGSSDNNNINTSVVGGPANLQIGAGAQDSFTVAFARVDVSAQGLAALDTALNSFRDNHSVVNAQALITAVDVSISSVNTSRSNLGGRQNRLEHTIANLGVAHENLSASESRIRDADMAQEMVGFTRGQILQQAGTAILAQANQQPQSILSLLR